MENAKMKGDAMGEGGDGPVPTSSTGVTGYQGPHPVALEWVSAVRSGLEESVTLARRMLEATALMAADVREIKAAVMGKEGCPA